MNKKHDITEDQLDLMHIIENSCNASQRQIAKNTGLSLGKVNYCIKELINIGFIKVNNFSKQSKTVV